MLPTAARLSVGAPCWTERRKLSEDARRGVRRLAGVSYQDGMSNLLVLIVIASISQQRRKIFIKSKNATLLWPLL